MLGVQCSRTSLALARLTRHQTTTHAVGINLDEPKNDLRLPQPISRGGHDAHSHIAALFKSVTYRRPNQMIEQIEIRNFRSFDDVEVRNCRRINVIVGENGSGKTAFLEGLFLAAGPSPEIALRIRSWRGMEAQQIGGTVEQIDMALWGDLFHKFNVKKHAVVALSGKGTNRSVTVMFKQKGKVVTLGKKGGPTALFSEETVPVTFRWKLPGGKEIKISPKLEDGALKIPAGPDSNVPAVFIAATRALPQSEAVARFSDLSRSFKATEFTDLFYEQFKNLSEISIETAAGSTALYARVTGLPQKIPLTLASGGMNKLAFILLSIPIHPGGIVLIDEIESGIYYKRLPQVWTSILALAKAYNVQIFASTHSLECLDAAADVAESCPEEFSVLRTVSKGGASLVRQFDGERFIDAMDENIEIR